MIRNYFLVAIRNLTRNKFFSTINVLGLAVSMSICMAIIMLVADQMTYDRYNTNLDRIYRINTMPVNSKGVYQGNMINSTSPAALRDELLENYTGFEKVVRFRRGFGNNWLEFEGQDVNIPLTGYYADPEVLSVFEYELEHGDEKTALVNPYSLVLTKKAAKKLFKEDNPVGLTLKVGNTGVFTVTGVLKDNGHKSHVVFEGLASISTIFKTENPVDDKWQDFWAGWTYVQLAPGKTSKDVEPLLGKVFQKRVASLTRPDTYYAKFVLQGLDKITPGPALNNAIGPVLPWVIIYFLAGLAGIILLTSCFNFTNLSIARSLSRAREIGVRKVTGAVRYQIFLQFLTESVVIALFALMGACLLLIIIKPMMLQLSFARAFKWDLQLDFSVFTIFFAFALMVGIVAGLFPAIVLSGFQPVKVLKNLNDMKLFSRMGFRKVLLVVQFTFSLIFILSVIVVYNQLDLFTGKDHGFTIKNKLVVRLNSSSPDALKTELQKYSNIIDASAASHIPASGVSRGDVFKKSLDDKDGKSLSYFTVDEDYLKNMDLTLLAGKFFASENGPSNKNFIVINSMALKNFDFKTPQDAVGEEVVFLRDSTRKTIIGVLQDYNHELLMAKIEPMALMYAPDEIGVLQIKYSGAFDDAVKSVEKSWATANPGLKLDVKDFESEVQLIYNTLFGDIRDILGVISFLAILISCMGLLGMATYSIETRMKEISVRKVLGATDQALVILLSKGFLKLLLLATLIGIPAAYFLNDLWLQFMAYRTSIGVGVIASSIFILFVLGTITIGSQTLRAAFTNPVDNLKNE